MHVLVLILNGFTLRMKMTILGDGGILSAAYPGDKLVRRTLLAPTVARELSSQKLY